MMVGNSPAKKWIMAMEYRIVRQFVSHYDIEADNIEEAIKQYKELEQDDDSPFIYEEPFFIGLESIVNIDEDSVVVDLNDETKSFINGKNGRWI